MHLVITLAYLLIDKHVQTSNISMYRTENKELKGVEITFPSLYNILLTSIYYSFKQNLF